MVCKHNKIGIELCRECIVEIKKEAQKQRDKKSIETQSKEISKELKKEIKYHYILFWILGMLTFNFVGFSKFGFLIPIMIFIAIFYMIFINPDIF